MRLARTFEGVCGGWRHPCALILPIVLIALAPLADASPSDPLWIAGISDGVDHDEVIAAASSVSAVVRDGFLAPGKPAVIIGQIVWLAAPISHAAELRSGSGIRAPPPARFFTLP